MGFEKIEKSWNYFYFNTIKLFEYFGQKIILKPLIIFCKWTGFFKEKKLKQVEKQFINYTSHKENSLDAIFARNIMMLTTVVLLGIITLYFVKIFRITVREEFEYIFIVIPILSYYLNRYFIKKDSEFIFYYKVFRSKKNPRKGIVLTFLVHLITFIVFIMSAILL